MSKSIVSLMEANTPSAISFLMTSAAVAFRRSASSPTVISSGTWMVMCFCLRSSAMRRMRSASVSLREPFGLPRYWLLRCVSFCFCTVLSTRFIFSEARRSYFSLYFSSSTCEARVSTMRPSRWRTVVSWPGWPCGAAFGCCWAAGRCCGARFCWAAGCWRRSFWRSPRWPFCGRSPFCWRAAPFWRRSFGRSPRFLSRPFWRSFWRSPRWRPSPLCGRAVLLGRRSETAAAAGFCWAAGCAAGCGAGWAVWAGCCTGCAAGSASCVTVTFGSLAAAK